MGRDDLFGGLRGLTNAVPRVLDRLVHRRSLPILLAGRLLLVSHPRAIRRRLRLEPRRTSPPRLESSSLLESTRFG